MEECKGLTKDGSNCTRWADNTGYCWQHSEEATVARKQEQITKLKAQLEEFYTPVENNETPKTSYVVSAIQCPKCGHLFK